MSARPNAERLSRSADGGRGPLFERGRGERTGPRVGRRTARATSARPDAERLSRSGRGARARREGALAALLSPRSLASLMAIAIAQTAACGGEGEPFAPLATETMPPAADAGSTPEPDAGEEPKPDGGGVVRRTVEQRNPFGHVAKAKNLLWDGDFEWHSPFADQYGWIPYPPSAASGGIRIGAACRSGIKCAAIPKGKGLIAIGVGYRGFSLEVSVWSKPKDGACEDVTVALVSDGASPGDPDAPIPAVSPAPDASGWCHHHAVVAERARKPYLYVKNGTTDEIVIDDAVVEPASPSQPIEAPAGPLTADAAEELESVKALVRSARGPNDPPPNAARRALEAWMKRGGANR